MSEKSLQSVREKIDALDEQIQTLINQRAQYALEIGKKMGRKEF